MDPDGTYMNDARIQEIPPGDRPKGRLGSPCSPETGHGSPVGRKVTIPGLPLADTLASILGTVIMSFPASRRTAC